MTGSGTIDRRPLRHCHRPEDWRSTSQESIGHRWIGGVSGGNRCARDDSDVVKARIGEPGGECTPGSPDGVESGLPDVIGAYPEEEPHNWSIGDAGALVYAEVTVSY